MSHGAKMAVRPVQGVRLAEVNVALAAALGGALCGGRRRTRTGCVSHLGLP